MSTRTVLPTGITSLDNILPSKGFPAGFTVLVEAPPGAWGDAFLKQLAFATKEPATFISTDEPRRDVLASVETFDWAGIPSTRIIDLQQDIGEAVTRLPDNAPASAVHTIIQRRSIPIKDIVEGEQSTDLLRDVFDGAGPTNDDLNELLQIARDPQSSRVFINSLDYYFATNDPQDVLETVSIMQQMIAHRGGTAVLLLTPDIIAPQAQRRLELSCDALLNIDVERSGADIRHYLAISRFRGGRLHPRAYKMKSGDGGISFEDLAGL